MLELEGIHCISANTDGIVCLFNRGLLDKYYNVCHNWEEIVGNTEMGNLEYTEYSKLIQESVNHYIAIKPDGEVKVKGRFDVNVELHKNNTDKIGRIERLAIQEYFTKGIPVEETIIKHENIFNFCIGVKATRDYHYEAVNIVTGEKDVYQRLVRFFVSNKGKRLLKLKNEESDATGAKQTKIAGENLITVFNESYILPIEDYDINYSYYINNAKEVIEKIERGTKKTKKIKVPKEQLSLF